MGAMVHRIELAAPGKNALGLELMETLIERLRSAGGAPVLLSGAGDAFSAGLNLKELAGLDAHGMDRFLRTLEAMVTALYTYPGPTVAHVNGHAIAGGCVIVACCDWRVATDDPKVRIGLNEVALGVRFPPKVMHVIRSRVPAHHHVEVMLAAGLHDPRSALRLGLVDEVGPDSRAMAEERLERFAAHPASAYSAAKADLRGDLPWTEADERKFVSSVLPLWEADDVRERLRIALRR